MAVLGGMLGRSCNAEEAGLGDLAVLAHDLAAGVIAVKTEHERVGERPTLRPPDTADWLHRDSTSSLISRCTVCSMDSPGSTKPGEGTEHAVRPHARCGRAASLRSRRISTMIARREPRIGNQTALSGQCLALIDWRDSSMARAAAAAELMLFVPRQGIWLAHGRPDRTCAEGAVRPSQPAQI